MKFDVTIKLNNTNKILKEHGLQQNGSVNKFFRDTVDRFCDPYVPFDSGMLKNNKRYPDNSTIMYVSPYAHYMYKGKKAIGPSKPKGVKRKISDINMKYQGAPKRGAYWPERMMSDREDEVYKDVQKFIDNGGK